jgi:hypothetical protein
MCNCDQTQLHDGLAKHTHKHKIRDIITANMDIYLSAKSPLVYQRDV